MSDYHDRGALDLGRAVRAGEISPVELVDAALERVARLDASVGAFVTVDAEAARAAAKAAEDAVLTSADPSDLPVLHGVPTAVKDLDLTPGTATSLGSAAFAGFDPPVEGVVPRLVREAGMISLGKSNTPELGLPCYTEPDVAPPARTPWDLTRGAGGSSGGAGAAVAAGLVPVAHGSDGGGSIRIPASLCGLVGLKPSRGRVSTGPVVADWSGLVCHGPLARDVRDAAAFLDVLAVPQPGDPSWAPPPAEPFLEACERDPRVLRVGRLVEPPVEGVEVHPECVAAVDDAAELLTSLGHVVEEIRNPWPADAGKLFATVWDVLACGAPVPPDREHLLRPLTRYLRERGRQVSGPQLAAALTSVQQLARGVKEAQVVYDVVLSPTLAQPPVAVGAIRDDEDPAADFAAQFRFTPFTAVVNVTGQPAISLPTGWTRGGAAGPASEVPPGLPVGVMLVGRTYAEETLLSLAAQVEAARPFWGDRRPEVW